MRRLPVLLLLVATVACGNGSAGDGDSGIEGRVTIGPQCPVEQTRSNTDGTFRIPLDAGSYSVVAGPVDGSSLPFGRQVEVVVKPGTLTHVDLSVDSGIR